MKNFRSVPKILKINEINEFRASLYFSTGEVRIVDFKNLLGEILKISERHPAAQLTENQELFSQMTILGNSIGWPEIGIHSTDENGVKTFYPFDLDPIVLYQNSIPDPKHHSQIGARLRQARKQVGMTQEELARRSGTTKHYISRIENEKSDIELKTLKKIVEAGLNKKLEISIS